MLGNGEGRFVRFIIGHNSLHFDSLLWRFRGGAARDKFQEFHDSSGYNIIRSIIVIA